MTRQQFLITALLLSMAGCARTKSIDELQNRKVLDALLTAITRGDTNELASDARLLDARRAEGHISQAHYDAVTALVARARSGDWATAEDELYKFREAHPYLR